MDDNVISVIISFTHIKCHSCHNEINSILKLKKAIKIYKFYYCNKECFNFC